MSELPAKVAYEDVDEVIAAAAKAMDREAGYLSVEELQQVAAELEIPARLIEPAIEEVRRRRAAELAREQAAARARERRRRIAVVGGSIAALVVLVWASLARAELRAAMLEVERQRSQVVNVLDRQAATRAQWEAAPDSPDKHAENRVRVERMRYDELVTVYRQRAGSLGGRLWVTLGGYPAELPLSSEVDGW